MIDGASHMCSLWKAIRMSRDRDRFGVVITNSVAQVRPPYGAADTVALAIGQKLGWKVHLELETCIRELHLEACQDLVY